MATIHGTQGNDDLTGSSGADILHGYGGNDVVIATLGNDQVDGGSGVDTLSYLGQPSRVEVDLGTGVGRVYRPGGYDTQALTGIEDLIGSNGNDLLAGDGNANKIQGRSGNDTLSGRGGDDRLYGDDGNDGLFGGDGSDLLFGGTGNDWMFGEAGNDGLIGGHGDDTMHGGNAQDTLEGGAGTDTLYGDAGDDLLVGGAGNDLVDGGAGVDTVSYVGHSNGMRIDLVTGKAIGDGEQDTLANIEKVDGSDHGDLIRGNDQTLAIFGAGGNDYIYSGRHGQQLAGGDGRDTVSYLDHTGGRLVDLAAGTSSIGDTLVSFENLHGSNLGDTLRGSSVANELKGYVGNDVLEGRGGNDTLVGGRGVDTLWGGTGADTFDFGHVDDSKPQAGQWDVIRDFNRAEGDRIDLSRLVSGLEFNGYRQDTTHWAPKEVTYMFNPATQSTYVMVNTDGDIHKEMVIELSGIHTLQASDFIV